MATCTWSATRPSWSAPSGEVRPTRFFGVPRVWEKIQTGIGGLLAMETDEAKKKAVADAMAVGLEYVESQQTGQETSPELQAKFDAVNEAVLTPMKSMLGLDRVTWAGSASAPMPLETARFFAGLGMAIYDIYGMTETTGSVTACGPTSFRLGTVGRAQPGIEMAIAEDGEILDARPGEHQRLPQEPRGQRRADRRRRLDAHRRHRRDRRRRLPARWWTARRK